MSRQELLDRVRAKYPEYTSWDDDELVNRWTAKYPEYKTWLDDEQPQASQPQAQQQESQVQQPEATTERSGGLQYSTGKEAFDKWKAEKFKQLQQNKGLDVVGGSIVDALGLTSRPIQAINAGIVAKGTGQGKFWDTAGKQLMGGDVSGTTGSTAGDPLADVTYGYKPTNMPGHALKAVANIGRDFIGVGGFLGGAGKAASAIGELKGLTSLVKVGKAINAVAEVPYAIETRLPNAIMTPALKLTGNVVKVPVAKAYEHLLTPGAKEWVEGVGRKWLDIKTGVNKAVVGVGEEAKGLKNELNNYTSEGSSLTERALDKVKNDKVGHAIEKERLGKVMVGKEPPTKLADGTDDPLEVALRQNHIKKQELKLEIMKKWQARLANAGIQDQFTETLKQITDPEEFFHRVYELDPAKIHDPKNVKNILSSIDEEMANVSNKFAPGDPKGAEIQNSLARLRKGYETADAKILSEPDLLGENYFADAVNKQGLATAGGLKGEGEMGVGAQSAFKKRILPDHIAQVFRPMTDADTILNTERGVDSAFAAVEARVGLLEGQAKKVGEAGHIPKAPEAEVENFKQEAEKSGLFKGIEGVLKNVYTDKASYEYLAQALGETSAWEKVITDYPLMKTVTNTWKSFKLFNPAAIFRNFVQGSSLAAQHGISQVDYVAAVRNAYKLASGDARTILPKFRKVWSRLNGSSGTSLSILDAFDPIAIKGEKGTEQIIKKSSQVNKAIRKSWRALGNSFRSTDDGLRISMFNKKVQELTGKPLEQSVDDAGAVKKAMQYVQENTIHYDELPQAARIMKMINPFFAFSFRAPKQYIKAMVENPALTGRYKSATESESQKNLKELSPYMRESYNKQRNSIAEGLNTFGGNIVIGTDGRLSGIPAVDYIDMAPFSFSMGKAGAPDFNASYAAQLGDVLKQASGVDLTGKASAAHPAVALMQGISGLASLAGATSGKSSEDSLRNAIQTLPPTVVTQMSSIASALATQGLKPETVARFPEKLKALMRATTPKQGSSISRNLMNALGLKTKVEDIKQLGESQGRAIGQDEASIKTEIMKEAQAMFPDSIERQVAYYREMLQKALPNALENIQRKLQ